MHYLQRNFQSAPLAYINWCLMSCTYLLPLHFISLNFMLLIILVYHYCHNLSSSFDYEILLQYICLASRKSSAPTPHLAPLPKGAGLRQDSIVSNISIFSDTHNAPILQTISAARLRDRRPDYLHFHKHRQIRTTKIQILAEGAPQLFIIHYSLFITHLYHQCTISIPLVISIHGNYFHRIYYFCISHNIP